MENNNNFELKEAFDLFDADGDGQVCLPVYILLVRDRIKLGIITFPVSLAYSQAYFYLGDNSRTGINV